MLSFRGQATLTVDPYQHTTQFPGITHEDIELEDKQNAAKW